MSTEKNNIIIQRACDSFGDKQTNGHLLVVDVDRTPVFACITLELPWRDNKNDVSHIPRGVYPARKMYSSTLGHIVAIDEVPGRSLIRIHSANKVEQLRGCVAVGKFLMDIDKDGDIDDISDSRNTLNDMLKCLPNSFIVTIIDAD